MDISLSEHFTFKKLLKFTLPSIIMMVFTSIYNVVDGIFVSNLVGKTQFAALNLIFPYSMIFAAVGFMIGAGGSALVSKTLGEGYKTKANGYFSMMVYAGIILGLIFTVIGLCTVEPVAVLFGATEEMLPYCVEYCTILMFGVMPFLLQSMFQPLMVTAERPKLGLWITVGAGLTNIVFDALLIGLLDLGLTGAAWATVLSEIIGGFIPLVYFIYPNKSRLRLRKALWDVKAFIHTCVNGSSEFVVNVSMSLVTIFYNIQLMKFVGEDGVAAYGVISYLDFIFVAIFLGYCTGAAPLVGFNYGSKNISELQNLFKKGLIVISTGCVLMTTTCLVFAGPLAAIFVSYDETLFELTKHALIIYSFLFFFAGYNIFGSSFFTALNNGLISAIISFSRTLLFQIVFVFTLPLIMGVDGIWVSGVLAEFVTVLFVIYFFLTQNKRYHYIK